MTDAKRRAAVNKILGKLQLFPSIPTIEYIWEMARLKSLENWAMTKPSVQEIAEAGFYCPNTNLPDTVKCFSCFIELDGWESTDNPWEEHRKRALALNPTCKFIEMGKKELDFTVSDFLEIHKTIAIRLIKEKCDSALAISLNNHKKKKASLKKDLQKLGLS